MTALTHLSPRTHPRSSLVVSAFLAVTALTIPLSVIISGRVGLPALAIGAAAGLLALALTDLRWEGADTVRLFSAAGVLLAVPAALLALVPTDSTETFRLAGDDRIATSVAVSGHVHETADSVVIVAADAAADAVTAAALAAHVDGPLLLAGEGMAAEVERLGARRAYVVGGGVDNDLLAAQLLGAGIERVVPVAGADRYATSAAVVSRIRPDRIFVTSGWTDAVAVAPLLAGGGAVLMVPPDALPPSAVDVLQRMDPATVVVVGGTAAVSGVLEDEVSSLLPEADVSRLAGDDRWATSVAAVEASGLPTDRLWLASGTSWPDALVGGAGAVAQDQPLLLVPDDGSRVASVAWLSDVDDPTELTVVGGAAAVPEVLVRLAGG